MTDTSKGLLPQLVEVLQALAGSQELLMHKVRDARLESTGDRSAVLETSESERPLGGKPAWTDPPARVVRKPRSAHDQTEPFSSRTTEVTQPPAAQSICVHPVVESSSANDALQKMRLQQPAGYEVTRQSVADAQNAKRDYNFFDELDARLDDLISSDTETNGNGNGNSAGLRDPKEH